MVLMKQTVNKGCLQKPKPQTFSPDKVFYHPHLRCNPMFNKWLKKEESKIDRKFHTKDKLI